MKSDDPGAGALNVLPALQLPPGPSYSKSGNGAYTEIPGTSKVYGTGGQLFKFDLEVEGGITGVDLNQFASIVMSSLTDPSPGQRPARSGCSGCAGPMMPTSTSA